VVAWQRAVEGVERLMQFTDAGIAGAFVIDLERREDDRGFFARSYCAEEFAEHGLTQVVAQCNVSYNHRAGTVRGLHYQVPPAEEAKLVRCTAGAIWDVVVDIRGGSPTYMRYVGLEITADNRRALYVPEGCAHGYQTLTDGAEVTYQVSAPYTPECERGLPHDDPAFGIAWPVPVSVLSTKDASWPSFARVHA
jgi:dTDP-4-dehydrorhamnose 3,5-epimerase